MPVKMKVSNQSEYNKFLQERGNIFHYINDAIENWHENRPKVAGGNNIYTDKVVILVHIITYLFRIGLRQTVGFIKGYLEQIGKSLQVISYSQASRRFKKLNIKINDNRVDKNNMENIEIAIDSTGIGIYNTTAGHNKKNNEVRQYRGREQARKMHVMLDISSKKVMDLKYTELYYPDHWAASKLMKNDYGKIETLYADGAYDRAMIYQQCYKLRIKTKIPPKIDAVEHQNLDYMAQRNTAVRLIRSFDGDTIEKIKQWKKEVGYGKRSYIEAFFSRLKQIFGFSFRNKSEVNREKELLLKCYLLNKFTDIGMATFEMVA
ncbi:IS5 family transposase [Wolbachia endosymbiont of Folsomia candida]|uniref:IS5 family transposase n=1 Tax=Wolbachia endosymbiont of Folsomia candida TaxID=169402 RepID=UPI000B1C449B|nr:IS5 family transposase [Wolbachia endosymbiont of Folsomia candida]AWW50855.1 IS5 family transposase [Wolbachia endosymbiont of Folsomia candida]